MAELRHIIGLQDQIAAGDRVVLPAYLTKCLKGLPRGEAPLIAKDTKVILLPECDVNGVHRSAAPPSQHSRQFTKNFTLGV